MIYRFDDFELDTDQFELRAGGVARSIEPQVFALIELLVSNHGRVVTKDELNLRVWGGRVVSEAVVNSRIRLARRAIGDDGKAQRLIRTVHNRGFRFLGEPVVENALVAGSLATPVNADAGTTNSIGASAVEGRPSIAVLPFQMLSGVARSEMFGDAVAHEIIVELSRLHWLFVIARGSSFRFRGPDIDLGAASEVLGVRYFLTGSVAIDGLRSIVTAELSQAADGRVLWADRFEGPVDELLGLRLTIAAKTVTALELRIPMLEARRAASWPTANLDSWSAYHRGLWHMYRFNAHDNDIAAHMFDRAIVADGNFARAYAGLSFTHFQSAFVGFSRDADTDRRRARELAEKSIALDPLDPFANLTMGRAIILTGDFEGAVSWLDRAVGLNPNYAFAIYNRALADAVIGLGSESEEGAMKAMSLSPIDPLHYAMLATLALSHLVRGDYAVACEWADRAAKAPNAHIQIKVIVALANELAGNRQASERWASEVRRSNPNFEHTIFFQAFPFRDEHLRAVAMVALKRIGL